MPQPNEKERTQPEIPREGDDLEPVGEDPGEQQRRNQNEDKEDPLAA